MRKTETERGQSKLERERERERLEGENERAGETDKQQTKIIVAFSKIIVAFFQNNCGIFPSISVGQCTRNE